MSEAGFFFPGRIYIGNLFQLFCFDYRLKSPANRILCQTVYRLQLQLFISWQSVSVGVECFASIFPCNNVSSEGGRLFTEVADELPMILRRFNQRDCETVPEEQQRNALPTREFITFSRTFITIVFLSWLFKHFSVDNASLLF
jgi:hypothetical protein